MTQEFNFDGLVGPTHNYAGLSAGNVASMNNDGDRSNPKAAALQGIQKMRFVHSLGVGQAVLPPQSRPHVGFLRSLGFSGNDAEVIKNAAEQNDYLLRAASSASSMWTANAATIAPSADTNDGRMHMVPANLNHMLHRAIEVPTTTRVLRSIFSNENHFCVHDALPQLSAFADEGAANHSRFVSKSGEALHLFAYGRAHADSSIEAPTKYPARQTLESTHALFRLLNLKESSALFAHQSPVGIDGGSFHTDVLAVANENVWLVHEYAFSNFDFLKGEVERKIGDLQVCLASESELGVSDAVKSYPFNSQLLTLPNNKMAIIAPTEARDTPASARYLERALAEIDRLESVHYRDVKQSMRNGGGPACLRLRVSLNAAEQKAANPKVFFSEALALELEAWVNKHYRDQLGAADLRDPSLYQEQCVALDALTKILDLGNVYPFQL